MKLKPRQSSSRAQVFNGMTQSLPQSLNCTVDKGAFLLGRSTVISTRPKRKMIISLLNKFPLPLFENLLSGLSIFSGVKCLVVHLSYLFFCCFLFFFAAKSHLLPCRISATAASLSSIPPIHHVKSNRLLLFTFL